MADNFISKIQIGSNEYKIRCEYSDILNTPTIGASNLKLKAQYTAATGTTADGGINIFNANSTSDSTFTITGSAGIKTFRTSGTNTVTIMHDNILSASGTTSPNHTSISNLDYGSSFYVPVISYNKTGHITSVSTASYKLNFADNKVTQSPISTEGKYPILLKYSIGTTEETNTTNFISDFCINPYSKELYGATIDAIVIKENSVTLASKYKSIQTAIGASYTVSLNGNTLQRHSIQQSSQGVITVNNGVDLFSFKSTPSSSNKVLTESDISGLVGAMVYKGTTTTISNNVLGTNPTISGNPVQGWTFVASSAVSITSSTRLLGKSMATTGAVEVGDMFVYNGTNWNIISGENQVSNSNPTLNFGSSHTLGTIDGTNFTVTMPANPNLNQKIKVGTTSFGEDDTISLVNGTNITITPDTSSKTITISAPSNISAFTNNASYATVSQLSNYLPLAGGSMNLGATITLKESSGISMILSGGSLKSVIPSTVHNGWARAIVSQTIDSESVYDHIGWYGDNGASGTGTGLLYTYLGGNYYNHILRLNKSDKSSQFFGTVKVPNLASGSYTYTMPSATGTLALQSDITDEKITPISSSTNAEFPILLTPQSGVNASNNGKPNFTSNVTINTASGIITASSFVKAGANSSEILMADGSTTLAPIIDGEYFPNAIQDYDGNWYDAVVIGTQVWMSENMATTHYSDGTAITGTYGNNGTVVPAATNAAHYFYYTNYIADTQYRERVGLLYNWAGAMKLASTEGSIGIAPSGWHIPTKSEVQTLINHVSSNTRYKDEWNGIGRAMAAQVDWTTQDGNININPKKNNMTGWSGKPGGYKTGASQANTYVGYNGYWWTSTEDLSNTAKANNFSLRYSTSPHFTIRQTEDKTSYRSVRCISDKSPLEFREWYYKTYRTLQHIVMNKSTFVIGNTGDGAATYSLKFQRSELFGNNWIDWWQNVDNSGNMIFRYGYDTDTTALTTVMTLATNALTLTNASVAAASFVKDGGTNSQILLAGGSVMNTSAFSASSHTHGNITNGGTITTNVAIASGDRLVITDSSATSSVNATSITFNGASTNTYLSQAGTWQTLKCVIGSATAQTAPSSATALYGSGNITLHNSAWTGAALTASKLSTARTIWGQSFDGSGNVNGTLYIDGSSVSNPGNWNDGIRIKPSSSGWTTILLGGTDLTNNTGTSVKSWSMHTYTGNFYLNKNGSGNVQATRLWGHDNGFTLGSTAASTYALNVGGTVYATINMIADGDITAGGDMRAKGNDLFLGPSTGAQGHIKYDNTDLSIKFIFD